MSASQLTKSIYGSTTPPSLLPAAEQNLVLALRALEVDGRVRPVTRKTSGNRQVENMTTLYYATAESHM